MLKEDFQGADYTKIIGIMLVVMLMIIFQVEVFQASFAYARSVEQAKDIIAVTQSVDNREDLVRFHVVANSDSEEDQALKRAVRDGILKELAPQLAESKSLEESRQILTGLRPEMEEIGRRVIKAWGKDYEVKTEYGNFIFPTKSYGTLILPAGEYEALRVVIGEGKGSNWWCVLFPPLCFVDIDHSTAQQVDGKPGIPYSESNGLPKSNVQPVFDGSERQIEVDDSLGTAKPKVKFWIVEKLKKL